MTHLTAPYKSSEPVQARTDLNDCDTGSELARPEIVWCRSSYSVRWLSEADASAIKALFYSKDQSERRLFRS